MDKRRNFQNIQALRLAACLMVFMVHFSQRMYLEDYWIGRVLSFGANGVVLFFVISGFLVANSCEQYARTHTALYIARRMAKVLPLYYVIIGYYYVVHTFAFGGAPLDPTGWGWLRYLFLLNGCLPEAGIYFWDNLGITWTIPHFVWAYILLPFVYKWAKTYWGTVICFLGALYLSDHAYILNGYFPVLGSMVYFLAGGVIYYSLKENKQMLTMMGLWILIVLRLHFSADIRITYGILFAQLTLFTAEWSVENNQIKKILQISDKYSFSMYLGHGIVFLHVLDRYLVPQAPEEIVPIVLIKGVVAIIGTAVVTVVLNRFVETPLQKWLDKVIDRVQKLAA